MNTQLMYAESQPNPSWPPQQPAGRARTTPEQIMVCLAVCMALQMTSFVLILPLFARRFTELGAGVNALGASEMAYALAATVAAPFMGALADRIGRRTVVLGSLLMYVLAFIGYLFASSASAFVILRGLAGALTAGMMPAATGIVADVAPTQRRAQWIGVLGGGASVGWIAGPILGGFLYDRWGYAVALMAAVGMAAGAFIVALAGLCESRREPRQVPALRLPNVKSPLTGICSRRPTSLASLVIVLLTYFAVMFAWAFIEPRFMFYAYDDLGWSSSMLGLVMSTYGISMMLGEFGLGRLSDTLGRKPVIVAGLVLFSAQFLGLAMSHSYFVIAAAFIIAGLGNALFDPALSASILDVAPLEHQSQLLGVKSTIGSVGNILGPALVVFLTPVLPAQGAFLIAAGVLYLTVFIVVFARKDAKGTRASSRVITKKNEALP